MFMASSNSSHLPFVSVIVLTLNGSDVIRGCLNTLLETDYPHYEVLVVNNGSTDGVERIIADEYPSVRLINLAENKGYAGGINEGIKAARGEILLPLNDDTEIDQGMLKGMAEPFVSDPKVGIVGCKILYPDRKTIQHAGAMILKNGCTAHIGYGEEDHGQYDEQREVDYVTGCSIAVRRSLFEELGLYDDRYFPTYYEETEFAVRARKRGWKIVYTPHAWLYHLESKTEVIYSDNFFYRNHRSRWRFILKNFSLYQVLRALKSEARYWWYMGDKRREGRALLRAYLFTLVRLPFILYDRSHRYLPLPPREKID